MALAVGGLCRRPLRCGHDRRDPAHHRFPGDVPVAVAALTGSAVGVLAVGRRVARLPEGDWRTLLFVGVVVAFWVLAVWAPQVAVAAVPAIYPLVFSTLPLRNALVVTT